ncbi:DUF5363 domain-containing protein [Pasteurellaceae bacterium LIM206]|nr:DUF5363 domain-containing protein [Pasteurellaceae bacterium LIM206]
MAEQKNSKKGWFKRVMDKYNAFCKDIGVDQGACRSCVPIVKFDEDTGLVKKDDKK